MRGRRPADFGSVTVPPEPTEPVDLWALDVLTVDQTAALIQHSRSTVYRLVDEGELIATRPCSDLRISRVSIKAFLERKRVKV